MGDGIKVGVSAGKEHLAGRASLRAILKEQQLRDSSVFSRPDPDVPPPVLTVDFIGGLAEMWAYLANFCDEGDGIPFGGRWHGWSMKLGFRPHLWPNGEYAADGEDELVAMRDLLVNMFDDCLSCERPPLYRPSSLGRNPTLAEPLSDLCLLALPDLEWVKECHAPADNINLSALLIPALESPLNQASPF